METHVVPEALLAAVNDTVSNVTATATVVLGAAPLIAAPAPAGTDDASALATASAAAHAANFLAVATHGMTELGAYAAAIGQCAVTYQLVDAANAAPLAL